MEIVAAAVATLAVLSVAGAVAIWRASNRLRRRSRAVEVRLDDRSHVIRGRLTAAPEELTALRSRTEHALWALERLDERLDSATTALAARKRGSDTLREQLLA